MRFGISLKDDTEIIAAPEYMIVVLAGLIMKKLIINALTSSRILLGFLFLCAVLAKSDILYLVIIYILMAISDIFDGKLARKYNLQSNRGAKFDVICDFIFIILATLSLVLIDLMPYWFLAVITLKLIEFFLTSGKVLKFDRFGRDVALMFYIFPIVAVLINSKDIILIVSIFLTICAGASSISRIKNMRKLNV